LAQYIGGGFFIKLEQGREGDRERDVSFQGIVVSSHTADFSIPLRV